MQVVDVVNARPWRGNSRMRQQQSCISYHHFQCQMKQHRKFQRGRKFRHIRVLPERQQLQFGPKNDLGSEFVASDPSSKAEFVVLRVIRRTPRPATGGKKLFHPEIRYELLKVARADQIHTHFIHTYEYAAAFNAEMRSASRNAHMLFLKVYVRTSMRTEGTQVVCVRWWILLYFSMMKWGQRTSVVRTTAYVICVRFDIDFLRLCHWEKVA